MINNFSLHRHFLLTWDDMGCNCINMHSKERYKENENLELKIWSSFNDLWDIIYHQSSTILPIFHHHLSSTIIHHHHLSINKPQNSSFCVSPYSIDRSDCQILSSFSIKLLMSPIQYIDLFYHLIRYHLPLYHLISPSHLPSTISLCLTISPTWVWCVYQLNLEDEKWDGRW